MIIYPREKRESERYSSVAEFELLTKMIKYRHCIIFMLGMIVTIFVLGNEILS